MKFSIEPHHFTELIKKSYSLDHIFLLKLIEQKMDILPLCEESVKIKTLHQGLLRKALITENGEITVNGNQLLEFLNSKSSKKIIKQKPASSEFEQWWKAFPGTDNFEMSGKKFTGSRALRVAKDDCRLKFDKILLEGEYTASELIGALKLDVLQKKVASVKEHTNKLKYMQNSLTYLNQRSYEPFIELLEKDSNNNSSSGTFDENSYIEKPIGGATDI